MKMVKSDPVFGPMGSASIDVIGRQLQIVMDETNEVVNVTTDQLPPDVDLKKLPRNKKYNVMVSGDRTKLTGFRPFAGSFVCLFVEIKKKPGQPPIHEFPRNRVGKSDKGDYSKDWHEFTALCRIAEAPYTGLIIPVKLRYYFTQGEDGNAVIAGEGKHSQYLARFLEVSTGDLEGIKIQFSDNILPQLERYLQEQQMPFLIVMANGWPDSFGDVPAGYLKAPKKSVSKKTAKKSAKKK